MTIVTTERRTYSVPEAIEELAQEVLESGNFEELNDLLADCHDDGAVEILSAENSIVRIERKTPEPEACEHVWRLNKHGRICPLCLKIEEGVSPSGERTDKREKASDALEHARHTNKHRGREL
jgi:hypothetical protein